MKLIRGLHNLTPFSSGSVVTIGNFDGAHLGHQAVFKQVLAVSVERNLIPLVITFDPHPREFFSGDCPGRLTRLREKLYFFHHYGIETVLCMHFNQNLADTLAHDFVQQVLLLQCRAKHIIVGDDFRFGSHRLGDFTLLSQLGQHYGFSVAEANTVVDSTGERISSTRIRRALSQGNLREATALLGHSYVMLGRVAHGDQLGRQLGFPTANIHLHRKQTPLQGVFAVKVHGLAKRPILGAANLGTRPAVGGTRCLLEVHLLDFNRDIYGAHIAVEFCHKLRDEVHYDTLDELKHQIARDVKNTREFFKK